jgi:charged multivesicular body protein 7
MSSLEASIETLNIRIDAASEKARSLVEKKNRTAALAALRSKKASEAALNQRMERFASLEEIYDKLQQAEDNVAMVKVMESSTSLLKHLHSQIGGAERVEDVVESLREEMANVDEIGTILESTGSGTFVDEQAIDDELIALEGQAKKAKAEESKEARDKQVEQSLNALAKLSLDEPVETLRPDNRIPEANT